MVYRLKTIQYKGSACRILLQNENGPCPLLAAANALLLKNVIHFPPSCLLNEQASLDDVTNLLANRALLLLQQHNKNNNSSSSTNSSSSSASTSEAQASEPQQIPQPSLTAPPNDGDDSTINMYQDEDIHPTQQQQQQQHPHDDTSYYLNELLTHIPTFQFGMDVNPQFTQGISGYEYTPQISTLDLLRVPLVHGWLVDPDPETTHPNLYAALQCASYNALVERVLAGRDAASALDQLGPKQKHQQEEEERKQDLHELQLESEQERILLEERVTGGALIEEFLNSTGHQLTQYGLTVLHEQIAEDDLVVFFRNNHFGTLTKHNGLLYLLVTDLGYAHSPDIVWEKLDVIDGDTEFTNSAFQTTNCSNNNNNTASTTNSNHNSNGTIQDNHAADYQRALLLSLQEQEHQQQQHQRLRHDHLDQSKSPSSVARFDDEDEEEKLIAAATAASLQLFHANDNHHNTATGTVVALPPLPQKKTQNSGHHNATTSVVGNTHSRGGTRIPSSSRAGTGARRPANVNGDGSHAGCVIS